MRKTAIWHQILSGRCCAYDLDCSASYAQQLQAKWQATSADDDVKRNDISHGFLSTKDPSAAPGLEQLFRLFHLLLPEELNTFSVAR